jgi:hypothetical protein
MRNLLIDIVVSIAGTIVLWGFGLANKIWPAHPLLATTVIVAACAIAAHSASSHHVSGQDSKPPR